MLDQWPSISEVARVFSEWLPELTALSIGRDGGVPIVEFELPAVSGIRTKLRWRASEPEAVLLPLEGLDPESIEDTRKAWERLYAKRPTRPGVVWAV